MSDPRSRILLTAGYILAVSLVPLEPWYRLAVMVVLLGAAMAVWNASPVRVATRLLPVWNLVAAALLGIAFGAQPQRALVLSARLVLISGAAVTLTSSLSITRLLSGFRSLGMPATVVSMLFLTSRYIDVVAAEVLSVRRAWLSRGGGRFQARHVVSLAHAALALVRRAVARSERIAWAMVSRGFHGQIPCPPLGRMQWQEVGATALGLALLAISARLLA